MEKIGICDWGIGGIGMMQHLCKLSHFDIVYLSDAGYTPYGKVSHEELATRWEKVQTFFKSQGVTKIAIACNALSTVVEENENLITVIKCGIDMINLSNYSFIGVTGGYRTVESKAYLNPLQEIGKKVVQSVGQKLSARVEAGDLDSEATLKAILEIFTPLENCDAVVLACTHYPVLENQINRVFPRMQLLDPAMSMANAVAQRWGGREKNNQIEWYTTGDIETMKSSARICFKEKIVNPIKIVL